MMEIEEPNEVDATGIDPDRVQEENITNLMILSARGDINSIRSIINHIRNIDAQDHNGNTALFYAIQTEVNIVKLLLDAGANPEIRNRFGNVYSAYATYINVYVTGIGDQYVCYRWNKYIYPWLMNMLAETNYELNIEHYDPLGFDRCEPEGGQLMSEAFDFSQNFVEPYVIFDFAHVMSDYIDSPLNLIYIPYTWEEHDLFFEYGLTPFFIQNGKIITYIHQLNDGDYTVIDETMHFLRDKRGLPVDINYRTIIFQGILFDSTKLKYLYNLIRTFGLKNVARSLDTEHFRKEILNHIRPGEEPDFFSDMSQIIRIGLL